MSVVLITGAYGFVGTHLSAYLAERGHEVWALDVGAGSSQVFKCGSSKGEKDSRQDAETQRPGERTCAGGGANAQRSTLNAQRSSSGRGVYVRCNGWEELEEIPWDEVDAVVHLAGKAHDTKNTGEPQSYFDVNVGLTKTVMQSAIGSWQLAIGNGQSAIGDGSYSRQEAKTQKEKNSNIPVKKFLLFSSVKAVADRVEGVLTEAAVPDPKTPYGQSKLAAEREVLKFESSKVRDAGETTANDANQANENHFRTLELQNLRTYILRPCMIHGPGNKGNLNLLYGMVRRGIPWPLGGFENRRSFASIENVCAVVEGLLLGRVASGVYQVADDEAISTNELICLMSEAVGRQAKIWRLPPSVVKAVAWIGDRLCLPLNSERLKKLTESYVASNAKIKAALGWDRMPVRARDGMRKTLESFGQSAVGKGQ